MSDQMIGVVLWADAHDRKAVIWCEDHGDLAYYTAPEATAHEGQALDTEECLDAGDLITFDIRQERNCRLARNPRRVNAGYAPRIARNLHDAQRPTPVQNQGDNVVNFPRRAG